MHINNNKTKLLLAITILLITFVGLTYAFFHNAGITSFLQNISATSGTTDHLSFQISSEITIEASQFDFTNGGNNKSGSAIVTALLTPNNTTGEATMNYYMYLNIIENGLFYSSNNSNENPELMLQVFDEDNELITLSGLGSQKTVKGVTGYDITGLEGLIPLLSNQEISTTNYATKEDTWRIVITLVNLDIDQMDNTGKKVRAKIMLQKDEYDPYGDTRGNLLAVLEDEIKYGNLLSEYRGSGYYHDVNDKDTDNPFFTRPIYYWYANNNAKAAEIKDKWNVVFGESCWQIIRTTDTGGIKLLYNGEPTITKNGSYISYDCSDSRANNAGIGTRESVTFSGSYYYGNSYTWNRNTQLFSLVGEDNTAKTMNASTGSSLEGKFTCKSSTAGDSCSALYYIDEYIGGSNAYAISLVNIDNRDNIGTSAFNDGDISIAKNGYMYEKAYINKYLRYLSTSLGLISTSSAIQGSYRTSMNTSGTINTSHNYASTYDWNETNANKYTLGSDYQSASDWYNSVECNGSYSCLVGKYTILNTSTFGTTLYYIVGVINNTIYYVSATSGTNPSTTIVQYEMGSSITDNFDGTYTINNTSIINGADWVTSHENYLGHFYCNNGNSSACTYDNIRYVHYTNPNYFSYAKENVREVTIASSISKNGNNYILNNPITLRVFPTTNNPNNWLNNYSNYGGYYMCSDRTSTSCSYQDVHFIYANGQSIEYYNNYIYGNNISYNSTTGYYTIDTSDAFVLDNNTGYYNVDSTADTQIFLDFKNNYNKVGKAHYTCFDSTDTCDTIYYIMDYGRPGGSDLNAVGYFYIELTDGEYFSTDESNTQVFKNSKNALYAMLYGDNSTNSTIKNKIDLWYKMRLFNYTPYIDEKEIYCNNRLTNNDYGSWNNNNNNIANSISYSSYTNNNDINCPIKSDSFSAYETTYGNGDLEYPIALLTKQELVLLSNDNLRNPSNAYWLMSPTMFYSGNYGRNSSISSGYPLGGRIGETNTYSSSGIRPSIAIKADATDYSQGDGSPTDPFVVEVGHDIRQYNINYRVSKLKAAAGEVITITNDNYVVGSFKLNGIQVIGNTFVMPAEDVDITDIKVYKIINNTNDERINLNNSAMPGETIVISAPQLSTVVSFKLNGATINGDSFTMPQDNAIISDVVITDRLDVLRNNPDYSIVDYLTTSGTQFIDPNYAIWKNQNWKIEYKFDVSEFYNYNNMFGSISSTNTDNEIWIDSSRKYIIRFPNTGRQELATLSLNTPYTITHDNTGTILTTTISTGQNTNTIEKSRANTSLNQIIGFGHRNGAYYLKGNIYYLILWSDGDIVRYMIPCVRNSDSTAGMYDIVNDVFYTNAGTGTFTVPS